MTLTANKGQCERTPLHFDVVYSVPGVVCPLAITSLLLPSVLF